MATCAHQVHGAAKRAGHRKQSDLEPGTLLGVGAVRKGVKISSQPQPHWIGGLEQP